MKKLNLKLDNIKEMLTKEQMKKIVGGYGGNDNCVSSYFYYGPDGCGITRCTGWANAESSRDCMCSTTITSPQPCAHV